jgi:hypothetical protein
VVFGQVAAGLTHHPAWRAFDGLTASGAEEEVILEGREGRAFLCGRHGDVVYEGHGREGKGRKLKAKVERAGHCDEAIVVLLPRRGNI